VERLLVGITTRGVPVAPSVLCAETGTIASSNSGKIAAGMENGSVMQEDHRSDNIVWMVPNGDPILRI
jgi:hypothetical protein